MKRSQKKRQKAVVGTLSKGIPANSLPVIRPLTEEQGGFGGNGLMGITGNCIPFGSDNLLPQALAKLNRESPVHRGILNRKVEFICGADWTTEDERLKSLLSNINADGEDFTEVLKKVGFDELSCGNAYIEMVTNTSFQYLNFYHHDYTTARISKDKKGVELSPNWRNSSVETATIPLYPYWKREGSLRRSMLHLKSYEPEFFNYGIPDWMAGLNVVAIGHKTDKWNLSRINNAFQPSGVFLLNGVEDDDEAEEARTLLEDEFSGDDAQGKVVFIVADTEGESGKFVPLQINFDADWTKLDENSTTKLVAAHSWYRSLMSLPDSRGFDTERILNEWRMANKTTIRPKQNEYLKPFKRVIKDVLGIDCQDLTFINKPPVREEKPPYMMVWEARREDGLDYDPNDPKQQIYLADLTRSSSMNSSRNANEQTSNKR